MTAFSVHQPYLIASNGFTNVQASSILTVRYLLSIMAVLMADRVIRRLGARKTAVTALLCGSVGFTVYGTAKSHLVYCIGSIFAGVSQGLGGMVLISVIIVTWFKSRQGMALGICAAGSGLASILLPPVITALIDMTSLSTAFFAEAAFVLCCVAVVAAVVRDSPEEKGLTAYRCAQTATEKINNYGGEAAPAVSVILALAYLLVGGIMVIDTGYASTLYAGAGHSLKAVSLLLSVNGVALALGKVLYGAFADRKGGRWTNMVFLSALVLGQALHCLSFTGSYGLALPAQILTGIGLPAGTVGVSVTAMNFSSPERFPKRVKTLQAMLNIGMLTFSILPGILADRSGSYQSSFFICFGAAAVFFLILIALYAAKKKWRAACP